MPLANWGENYLPGDVNRAKSEEPHYSQWIVGHIRSGRGSGPSQQVIWFVANAFSADVPQLRRHTFSACTLATVCACTL